MAQPGSEDDPPPPDPPDPAKQVFAVLLLLTSFTALALSALAFFGDRGNTALSAISIFVGLVSATLKISVTPRQVRALIGDRSRWVVTGGVAGLVLVGAGVVLSVYQLARVQEVPVTIAQDLRVDGVEGTDDVATEQPAVIVLASTPERPLPDRRYLGLRLRLDDYRGDGDCTTFATLALRPRLGDIERPEVRVDDPGTVGGEPDLAEIQIGGAVPELQIDVSLRDAPAGCRVRLIVTEAVFYG